jgi:hypothetical protein
MLAKGMRAVVQTAISTTYIPLLSYLGKYAPLNVLVQRVFICITMSGSLHDLLRPIRTILQPKGYQDGAYPSMPVHNTVENPECTYECAVSHQR